jgi:peptidoglycan/xylan/chitin deacetylase (PgdA/CDA1 family)
VIRVDQQVRHSLDKTVPPWSALLLGKAPGFVYGRPVTTLPVIVYHDVDDTFIADLRQLAAGGYSTVGAAEVEAYMRGDWVPGARTVALTFDDGLSSLTRVAVPLLAQFGFRATAFVVTGLVPPTSTDTLAGWSELAEAVRQKVLDVGSHSVYHHQVPVSSRVVGWVTRETEADFLSGRLPIPRLPEFGDPQPGDPIFVSRPRYLAFGAYRPDADAIERCRALARLNGASVGSKEWKRRFRERARRTGSWETPAEAEAAIRDDIAQSLATIRKRCPNPADRHVCYPWYGGNDRTDRLAKEAGAEVVYGGIWKANRPAGPTTPATVGRLPHRMLWRLPAPGRLSFSGLLVAQLIATIS